jgi:hypothetical protein
MSRTALTFAGIISLSFMARLAYAADSWHLALATNVVAHTLRNTIRISADVTLPTPCDEAKIIKAPATDPKSPRPYAVVYHLKASMVGKVCAQVIVPTTIRQTIVMTHFLKTITVKTQQKTLVVPVQGK